MENTQNIKKSFQEFTFGDPLPPGDIAEAEMKLGHALPDRLKVHYAAYDGFSGPTEAQFFFPLSELVSMTLFFRSEPYFPQFLQRCVALGEDGTGPCWLINVDSPHDVLQWDAEWGEDFETLEGSLTDIWITRKIWYGSVAGT